MTTLRIAAQSHDALTPAGGDTMKPLNPGAFDEDANYQQLFKRPGVLAWLKNCGVCPEKLSLTILGHGLLGNILDIADKLAYTGTDTHHFLARNWPKYFAWENFGDAYDRIQSLLKANPYPCSIWECTEQRNGELVFTDTARLADFLRLRSLMFSILYCNAASRFMEAGLITEVASILYQDGILNPKNLLEMTDNELFEVLNQSFDGYGVFSSITFASKADPRVNLFRTQEEALDFEREVAADNSETMTVFEKGFGASTKCLDTFKVLHKRKVVPFSQACPYESWDIRRIGVDPKPFRVYSYNMAPIFRNKAMCQRLLASRNERITKNQ
jgi:hypothetical protein